MHVSDGILTAPLLAVGFVSAGALAWWGGRGLRDEEPPRVAVFTAAFFGASLLHFPVPPTSVHLLLNGLLGVVLGRRALLAFPVGLGLQAALLGHGGLSVLGVNATMFGLAALLASAVYALLVQRAAWPPFWGGVAAGALGVLATGVQLTGLLGALGEAFWPVAQFALLAHLPVLGVEAVVTGFTVQFLHRVQPALLPRVPA